ncbi:mechanosensitive ion channel family protein [Sulfitobacter sp. F26204]|uniref:mechanosensitive ion channel family protein n=1 Tax=Sulfitobacter sp. F26204 TaxID=2996014 RepID=UPI00225E055F|nr:mechanosensitive ion channel family protein [Sulfitobacter sp. F26204]MCX7561197.1 mechanosensitive ion channel family protein [Sulfitobacter sp. F26204]
MNIKHHLRHLFLPAIALSSGIGLALYQAELPEFFSNSKDFSLLLTASIYLAAAWVASRLVAMVLDQIAGNRPYPRLLKDLITAFLFLAAFVAIGSLYMGQGAFGALAGSTIILALIGFAIRNVVADTLSGIALAVEAPFRIGDWIDIDTLAQGKAIEIGWRTTRLLTVDGTYLILPNSQISRQRITNFSAPKKDFRAQVNITLDHVLSIGKAREIMSAALKEGKLIQQDPAPDIRVRSYEEGGISYTVRYWVPRFERMVDCRDEVYSLIDDALRQAGSVAPYRRIQLVSAATDDGSAGAKIQLAQPEAG